MQAAAHVAARDARIPAELMLSQDQLQGLAAVDGLSLDSLLTPMGREITSSSSVAILQKVANGDWSAVDVVRVRASFLFSGALEAVNSPWHLDRLYRHSALER